MIKLKDLLKEYVDTDVVQLQQYLNSTPEQNADEIAGLISYKDLVNEYFKTKTSNQSMSNYAQTLEFRTWNVLKQKDSVLYDKMVNWLMVMMIDDSAFIYFMEQRGISAELIPSWFWLKNPTLLKNQWFVHGTTRMDGRMMARKGFIKGIADPTKLGLTTWLEGKKIGDGYNFAYTPEDFAQYGVDGSEIKYGDGTLLVFRASGIRCWHQSDNEFQVIFHGKTARDIVFVDEVMGTYTIHSKKGNPLVQTNLYGKNSPVDLVQWVIDNYDQYRKSIGWEKKPV